MIVAGMLVCGNFLISVCMVIVSKVLLISSNTVITRAGGAIWLNPLAERWDKGMYEMPLSTSLLDFGMGTMLANFHRCCIMMLLRAVFKIIVRKANPRGPMCLGAWCLVCQDHVSCYYYFVLLPLELW